MRRTLFGAVILWAVLAGCAAGKAFDPAKKFSPKELQSDYAIFQAALEEAHPSLYWYTPKDSVDASFAVGRSKLTDSLTESGFRYVLAAVLSKIRCGHTTVRPSKAATAYVGPAGLSFPLFVKAWPDTVVVTANLNRRDTVLTRGSILKSIDGRPINTIIDSLFQFLSADGYNLTHKYQTLSNGSNFRTLYAVVFGLKMKTPVEFTDKAGVLRSTVLNLYDPRADTPRRAALPLPVLSKRERRELELQQTRSLRIDTALHAAFLEVNTFTKGAGLRRFFRRSFREIKKLGIPNLVLDLRGNGGGNVVLSNLLTKYIADKPFVIADSLYALRRNSAYARYRSDRLSNWLFLHFLTRRRSDGKIHFGWFENKAFKPKNKNHFKGTTYLLTGGNTFSAASLVAKSLREQSNVIVLGEETGGGAYGNTAWLIPDVTLPNTGVRFRLPLFRLVIDKNAEKGRGVQPEVPALPTVEAIRSNEDFKMEKAKTLIRAQKN